MSKKSFPESVRQFIARQKTLPVEQLGTVDPKERRSPYGSYWYRAVACILLSGRVQAKYEGGPNMTDVHRVGKEANFNPYLIERVGKFLLALGAIWVVDFKTYEPGPALAAFWSRDLAKLPTLTQHAVLRLVQHPSYPLSVPHSKFDNEDLIDFLTLFLACFQDRALPESQLVEVFRSFVMIPDDDLVRAARGLGLSTDPVTVAGWRQRLDARCGKSLIDALYTAEWAYYARHDETDWIMPSPIGLAMLGLAPPPPAPELALEFKAQSDLTVFAGAGLPWEKLVPLFRYGTIKRIDQIYEFKLDRKKMATSPSTSGRPPGEQLREALRDLEPLPSTIADLLKTKSKVGGRIGIRWCSALVHPEDADVMEAIRAHPKLKGYIEPGAPPGYLLIKFQSNPDNFVQRCQDMGFKVEML